MEKFKAQLQQSIMYTTYLCFQFQLGKIILAPVQNEIVSRNINVYIEHFTDITVKLTYTQSYLKEEGEVQSSINFNGYYLPLNPEPSSPHIPLFNFTNASDINGKLTYTQSYLKEEGEVQSSINFIV